MCYPDRRLFALALFCSWKLSLLFRENFDRDCIMTPYIPLSAY